MKDGRVLDGKHAELAKVDEKIETIGERKVRLIYVLDDGLRYIYFSKYNTRPDQIPEVAPELQTFKTGLSYSRDGDPISVLGECNMGIPFDGFGCRLLAIPSYNGTKYVSQVITELTPKHVRVRGIRIDNRPIYWDMRLATNSLRREELTPILMSQINSKNIEDRRKLVRFYVQGNLYESALAELDGIMNDWKTDPEVQQELLPNYRMIRQMMYERRIDELEIRWNAGQYKLVRKFLAELEQDAELPEELFMKVRRMIQRYDDFDKKRNETIENLRSLLAVIPDSEQDAETKEQLTTILNEIESELSFDSIKRLETYFLYANDKNLSESERLSIGITGWFAGPGANNRNLAISASFLETRNLIIEYLQTEQDNLQRIAILERLKKVESARPDLVIQMMAYIKPPKESQTQNQTKTVPENLSKKLSEKQPQKLFENQPQKSSEKLKDDSDRPGYYRFAVEHPLKGFADKIEYVVQLPPEYDSRRSYPIIVTLNGLGRTPDMQLDWWAGQWRGNERFGQATRHGYIVIAPDWNPMQLMDHDFSAFSHAAVLFSLKDAFRRFNVDTDRVFITGHGIGGTAAWDMALAHPDLWAGAIPFNAIAHKYITAYKENAQYVPFYLIIGELEGMNNVNKFALNASVYNQYLARQMQPFDVTLVRFIGRGVEDYYEEILNLFAWMNIKKRNFNLKEFNVNSMRAWDCFFWGVELDSLDQEIPDYMTDPIEWPTDKKAPKMLSVRWKQSSAANSLQLQIGPRLQNIVLFLTPEMIDVDQKTSIQVGSKNYHPSNGYIKPDIQVILEDVRTRGDRLHPFWVRLDGKK
ncbi:MAG: hypothetical protein ACRCUY_08230 [Thermoguttaceae bacterium]